MVNRVSKFTDFSVRSNCFRHSEAFIWCKVGRTCHFSPGITHGRRTKFVFLNLWGSVLNLLAKSREARKRSNALSEESPGRFQLA